MLDLPSGVLECVELQKFKAGGNKFKLDRHNDFGFLIKMSSSVICLFRLPITNFSFRWWIVFALQDIAHGFPVGVLF